MLAQSTTLTESSFINVEEEAPNAASLLLLNSMFSFIGFSPRVSIEYHAVDDTPVEPFAGSSVFSHYSYGGACVQHGAITFPDCLYSYTSTGVSKIDLRSPVRTRVSHCASLAVTARSAVLFGGLNSDFQRTNDAFLLRVSADDQEAHLHALQQSGDVPSARAGHAFCSLGSGSPSRFVVLGGKSPDGSILNNIYVATINDTGGGDDEGEDQCSSVALEWKRVNALIPGRGLTGSLAIPRSSMQLWLFAGCDMVTYSDRLWLVDVAAGSVTPHPVRSLVTPAARMCHTGVLLNGHSYLIGGGMGYDGTAAGKFIFDDVFFFDAQRGEFQLAAKRGPQVPTNSSCFSWVKPAKDSSVFYQTPGFFQDAQGNRNVVPTLHRATYSYSVPSLLSLASAKLCNQLRSYISAVEPFFGTAISKSAKAHALTRDQFAAAVETCIGPCHTLLLSKLFDVIDSNGDGNVQMDEWDAFCSLEGGLLMDSIFGLFDIDGDGKISLEEFQLMGAALFESSCGAISALGGRKSDLISSTFGLVGNLLPRRFEMLFVSLDTNHDGTISRGEFSGLSEAAGLIEWLRSLMRLFRVNTDSVFDASAHSSIDTNQSV